MRRVKRQQLRLGETDIANLEFDLACRDDIPKLLMGLQHIYTTPELRDAVFEVLFSMILPEVDCHNGRPGMDLWNILVLGTLRLNLNCDYDRLQDLANNHKAIRQVLGHGLWDDGDSYRLQTMKDNVSLFTPEILDNINQIVVSAGHQLLGGEVDLRGKCDSFVVETDVHYPTDINLLFDAIRKVIHEIAVLCSKYGYTEWRKSQYNIKKAKKLYRKAQQLKRSTSQDPDKKAQKEQAIADAHQAYLDLVSSFLDRVRDSKMILREFGGALPDEFSELDRFIQHAERQIDQIRRRVIEGEIIPHDEKAMDANAS